MDEEKNMAQSEETVEQAITDAETRTIPGIGIPNGISEDENSRIEFEPEPVVTYSVSTQVDKEGIKELAGAGYEHAKDTMKPDSKIDPVVGVCGLFGIGCFCVGLYNGIKNGFDATIIVLLVCYVCVAVFCLCKPVQRFFGRIFYGFSYGKRLKLNKEGKNATFDAISMSFEDEGKERVVYYDGMWTGYITDKYYVFHVDDKLIIPVSKEKAAAAALDGAAQETAQFFEDCIHKADKTAPEEEVPDITR